LISIRNSIQNALEEEATISLQSLMISIRDFQKALDIPIFHQKNHKHQGHIQFLVENPKKTKKKQTKPKPKPTKPKFDTLV
jgi:nucleosome binding factor SPN SPT16 subunit